MLRARVGVSPLVGHRGQPVHHRPCWCSPGAREDWATLAGWVGAAEAGVEASIWPGPPGGFRGHPTNTG